MDIYKVGAVLLVKSWVLGARWAAQQRLLCLRQAASAPGELRQLWAEVMALRDENRRLAEEHQFLKRRLAATRSRKRYPWSQRLWIIWHLTYFDIPRRRVKDHFGVARSSLQRWLGIANRGDFVEHERKRQSPRRTPAEVAKLIWEVFSANPHWGRHRVAMAIWALGISVAASTVRNVLLPPRPRKAPAAATQPKPTEGKPRRIIASYPNHVWSVDRTGRTKDRRRWLGGVASDPWRPICTYEANTSTRSSRNSQDRKRQWKTNGPIPVHEGEHYANKVVNQDPYEVWRDAPYRLRRDGPGYRSDPSQEGYRFKLDPEVTGYHGDRFNVLNQIDECRYCTTEWPIGWLTERKWEAPPGKWHLYGEDGTRVARGALQIHYDANYSTARGSYGCIAVRYLHMYLRWLAYMWCTSKHGEAWEPVYIPEYDVYDPRPIKDDKGKPLYRVRLYVMYDGNMGDATGPKYEFPPQHRFPYLSRVGFQLGDILGVRRAPELLTLADPVHWYYQKGVVCGKRLINADDDWEADPITDEWIPDNWRDVPLD